MKKNLLLIAFIIGLSACAANDSDRPESVDDYHRVTHEDSVNAGLTGTTNANGFIPADSNKSISNMKPPLTDSTAIQADSSR